MIQKSKFHVNKVFILIFLFFFFSCKTKNYNKGAPIIVDKSESLNGKAIYTYEGYGRSEDFEDNFDKYEIGDTLRGRSRIDTIKNIDPALDTNLIVK